MSTIGVVNTTNLNSTQAGLTYRHRVDERDRDAGEKWISKIV